MRRAILGTILLFSPSLLPLGAQDGKPAHWLAAIPPMGWSSWDSYGLTINETEYKANVNWMAKRLKQFGWQYAVIEEGWYLQNPKSGGKPAWQFILDNCKTSKCLGLVPERVAIAAEDDGWIVRDIIIWHKKNPVPESVKDRCTRSYEPILMLTKKKRYYWDAKAIEAPATSAPCPVKKPGGKYGELKLLSPIGNAKHQALGKHNLVGNRIAPKMTRNKRNVWTIATEPHRDAHVAQFPSELLRLGIKAGSRPGDLVLDPFAGSGTTGIVARELGRNAVLLDISAVYAQMMREKLEGKKHDKAGIAQVEVDSGEPL